MKRKPNHFHLQAVSGRIVPHFHTTLGGAPMKAHEHDGLRSYATTRKAIERRQAAYLKRGQHDD